MALKSISELKNRFLNFFRPTQQDFADLIDSTMFSQQGFRIVTPTEPVDVPVCNVRMIASQAGPYNNHKQADGTAIEVSATELKNYIVYLDYDKNKNAWTKTLNNLQNSVFIEGGEPGSVIQRGNDTSAAYSLFLGVDAGKNSSNIEDSNFIGRGVGAGADFSNRSNFMGLEAGSYAAGAQDSVFLGTYAGGEAVDSSEAVFIGFFAGGFANNASFSIFLGRDAGIEAFNSSDAVFIGHIAGALANDSSEAVFIGYHAGVAATSAYHSIFFGSYSGYEAAQTKDSFFCGPYAGYRATSVRDSSFIGQSAGYTAPGAKTSTFIGHWAGYMSTGADQSVFIGTSAGNGSSGVKGGIFIGLAAGYKASGSHNIIIGTSVSLPSGTSGAMNIGGVLFGTGLHTTITENVLTTPTPGGKIGIGVVQPKETMHVNGSVLSKVKVLAADPTATDIPDGYSMLVRNSTTGLTYLYANIGGSLIKSPLT